MVIQWAIENARMIWGVTGVTLPISTSERSLLEVCLLLNRVFTSGLTSFEVKIRLNKTFRLFNFLQKRKGERLSWFAFSSRRGTFDRGWLSCPRIETDGFWFFPCWTGFVRRFKSVFDVLNRGTCRGCICSFNELVKLAQITNCSATWVTDPIRTLHEMSKRQSNFFTNVGWHNPKAILSLWWPEQIFWRRMPLLSKISSKFNFKRSRTY